jgi:hypothetical protein
MQGSGAENRDDTIDYFHQQSLHSWGDSVSPQPAHPVLSALCSISGRVLTAWTKATPCVYFLLELVPSFSWQMDVFIRKKRETESVFCGTVPIEPSQPAENVTLVLSFPYVCPEPVLVKCSFLYINGAKSGVFRTQSVELC